MVVLLAHLSQPPPPLSSRRPDLPGAQLRSWPGGWPRCRRKGMGPAAILPKRCGRRSARRPTTPSALPPRPITREPRPPRHSRSSPGRTWPGPGRQPFWVVQRQPQPQVGRPAASQPVPPTCLRQQSSLSGPPIPVTAGSMRPRQPRQPSRPKILAPPAFTPGPFVGEGEIIPVGRRKALKAWALIASAAVAVGLTVALINPSGASSPADAARVYSGGSYGFGTRMRSPWTAPMSGSPTIKAIR